MSLKTGTLKRRAQTISENKGSETKNLQNITLHSTPANRESRNRTASSVTVALVPGSKNT
jgi:hypothetical protein